MGFISLLLAVGQTPISKICIPAKAGSVMLPCKPKGGDKSGGGDGHRRLLWYPGEDHRRFLAGAGAGDDYCVKKVRPALQSNILPSAMMTMMMEVMKSMTFLLSSACYPQGKVSLISANGVHQLHIFIFVLAVFHVVYSVATMALARLKVSTSQSSI